MTTETLAAFQTDNYEIAEAIAPTWERRREEIERACAPVRDWMVRELRPAEGNTVLELAAGLGDTGYQAAVALGRARPADHDRLLARDARCGPPPRGGARVRNATYEVMDAERLSIEADSVDGVLCRFGYMLMTDQAKALSETRRVLRPGGRVSLACWGAPERNPFFGLIGMSLGQRGHIPRSSRRPPREPSAWQARSARPRCWKGAASPTSAPKKYPFASPVEDVDGYLSLIADTAGPVALALRLLPAPQWAAVKADVEGAFPHSRSRTASSFPVSRSVPWPADGRRQRPAAS